MIIMGDKKKVLSAILGQNGEEIKKDAVDDAPEELEVVAGELIDAVHAKDPKAVVDSLKAAWECLSCSEEEPDSDLE